jgi:hypothetical protein
LRFTTGHPDFVDNHVNTRWLEQTLLPAYSMHQRA